MSLVKAENRRLFKRRMTKWSLVIGVLILAAIFAGIFFSHQKSTPQAIAAAEAQAEQQYQQAIKDWETRDKALCESSGRPAETCVPPQREWFQGEHLLPPSFSFKGAFGDLLIIWAAIMAMIAFLIGATFVGAEWSSGAMMNLLTWRPKRMSVLGTKLGVLLGGMTIVGVVTFALWTGGLWLTGQYRGDTNGMTSGTWQSFGLSGLRGIGMILLFATLGFTIASIGRHTALAMGLAIGVIVVGQIGLSIVLQIARVAYAEQYLIPVHMTAWLNKQITLTDYSGSVSCGPNGCDAPQKVLTYTDSGLLGLGLALVIAAIAFWSIRRRDIA
ncbi:ABC transporter permease subunit [Allorhizocola rhizosphaerae]|uniref:ABC transporter permease subunit n=1 Tax=Allorhizocola rhizosphaerae TaxID=1872709 RepID=UPI000E3C99AE|nr:ABC transporter permease subunit [Allorhizocola rhizosphaerae]